MSTLLNALTRPADKPRAALRLLLAIDALTCAGFALLVLGASGFLTGLTGLPPPLLRGAGAVLIVATLALTAAAVVRDPPSPLVWLVTAINVAWVAASLAVIAVVPGVTTIGQLIVVVQALVVAGTVLVETRALFARNAAREASRSAVGTARAARALADRPA